MASVTTFLVLAGVAMSWQGVVSAGLNSNCSSNSDCSTVEFAVCTNGVCSCNNVTVAISGTCKEAATDLGGGCEEERQCTLLLGPNLDCLNFQCTCKVNYTAAKLGERRTCLEKRSLNQNCQADEQCVLTNFTRCADGLCACKPTYSDAGNTQCLPDKRFGEDCIEHSQCYNWSGPMAGCRQSKCVCEKGYFYNSSRCLKKNGLGERCSTLNDGCFQEKGDLKYIECSRGICNCTSNSVQSSDGAYCVGGAIEQALVSLTLLLAAVVTSVSI